MIQKSEVLELLKSMSFIEITKPEERMVTFFYADQLSVIDSNIDGNIDENQKRVLKFCLVARNSKEIMEHISVIYHSNNIRRYITFLWNVNCLL